MPDQTPAAATVPEPTEGGAYVRDPITGVLTREGGTAPAEPVLQRSADQPVTTE